MAGEWPLIRIGDYAESVSVTHPMDKTELVFLNTSDVLNGELLHRKYSRVKDWPGQAKKSIKRGDVLFSEIRPANGRYAFVDWDADDFVVSTKLMVIRSKEPLSSKYLYHFLTSGDVTRWLQHLAESRSGTFPQITFDQIAELELPMPERHEQDDIVNFIESLNNKICVNRKMNETLEAMARALFKSWFVDFDPVRAKAEGRDTGLSKDIADLFPDSFVDSELGEIPEGWRTASIKELTMNIQYGLTQGASTEPVGPKFLRITDIQGGDVDWGKVPYCRVSPEEQNRYRLIPNDILVARTGASTGENIYLSDSPEAVFASYLVRFQFAEPAIARLVGVFMRSSAYFEYVKGCLGGSAQPNASAQVLAGAKMVIPGLDLAEKYYTAVGPMDRKKSIVNKEVGLLSSLRDALLPKLISGEIRVGGDR